MEKNHKNRDMGVKYRLNPKACLGIVLTDTRISPVDLLEDFEDHTFQSAFIILLMPKGLVPAIHNEEIRNLPAFFPG